MKACITRSLGALLLVGAATAYMFRLADSSYNLGFTVGRHEAYIQLIEDGIVTEENIKDLHLAAMASHKDLLATHVFVQTVGYSLVGVAVFSILVAAVLEFQVRRLAHLRAAIDQLSNRSQSPE